MRPTDKLDQLYSNEKRQILTEQEVVRMIDEPLPPGEPAGAPKKDPITGEDREEEEDELTESEEIVTEGLLSIMNKILVFLGIGYPKDPDARALRKGFQRGLSYCARAHKAEVTRTSKEMGDKPLTPQEERRVREEITETIKENPEFGKCLLRTKLEFSKGLVELADKKGVDICAGNKNRDLCEKWVDKYIPEIRAEIKYIESSLKTEEKKGEGTKAVININKLQKMI